MTFRDREEGGYLLARELAPFRRDAPLILALPRGGLPVAFQVAIALGAPLHMLIVRKDGAVDRGPPTPPAATAPTQEGLRKARLEAGLRALAERQTLALAKRLSASRLAPASSVADRTVILVDDLVARGERAHAASVILRKRRAARVVVAAPVIALPAERLLQTVADAIVAVRLVPEVRSLEDWYERLDDLPDEDVIGYVERALWARAPVPYEHDFWDGEWIGPDTTEAEGETGADVRRGDAGAAPQRHR